MRAIIVASMSDEELLQSAQEVTEDIRNMTEVGESEIERPPKVSMNTLMESSAIRKKPNVESLPVVAE